MNGRSFGTLKRFAQRQYFSIKSMLKKVKRFDLVIISFAIPLFKWNSESIGT